MAFRDKTIMTPILPTGEDVPLYNLNFGVGRPGFAPNRRDDVLMVQYFLKLYYDSPGTPFQAPGAMIVDGIVGPVTQKFIRSFQADVNKMGSTVVVDGQMDQVKRGLEHKFSLGALNRLLSVSYQNDFSNMGQRRDCPPELVAKFNPPA